jgi:hypothetical protein
MKRIRLALSFLGCILAVTSAYAQTSGSWGSTHFVRLGKDRIIVFSRGTSYDFQRYASWDISDAKRKQQFEAWVKQAGLPKDPGQFVTDLPPKREVSLAAEILVGKATDDGAALSLNFKGDSPVVVGLVHKNGWSISAGDRDRFKQFAAKLHATMPTLLVALSGASKPSEEEAWAKLLQRAQSTNGYVTPLAEYKYALWSHGLPTLSVPATPVTAKPPAGHSKTGALPSKGTVPWLLPAAGGGVLLLLGALIAIPKVRSRVFGGTARPVASASGTSFRVGAHEQELILKVRDEVQRSSLSAKALGPAEEYVVGMMMERYEGYDALVRERDQAKMRADSLQDYKDYQERYEAFESRFTAATAALAEKEVELARQQTAQKDLQEKVRQAEIYVKKLQQEQTALTKSLEDAEALIRETGEWGKAVSDRLNAQAAKIHHE